MSGPTFEKLVVRRPGLTRDLPAVGDTQDLAWVANTATLVMGARDAVLVDTFATIEQNDRLVEWVASHGRRLTHVYVTHGHGDHVFGVGQVLAAFPDAAAVATAGTVAATRGQAQPEVLDGFWGRLFPGQIPEVVVPAELEGDAVPLEDWELRVIRTGFTDTRDTTSLWVPDIGLLVAGDVVYNHTHPFLGETTAGTRRGWVAALRGLAELDPTHVVAGHPDPARDDSPTDIEATIGYLEDFEEAETITTTALELYEWMLRRHGGRVNPGSLWGAAKLVQVAE
jgi:glyoxylase-like metal-dependent hydrolase (beta-lactamase superfamily II)